MKCILGKELFTHGDTGCIQQTYYPIVERLGSLKVIHEPSPAEMSASARGIFLQHGISKRFCDSTLNHMISC
jgi:hypothetical protein